MSLVIPITISSALIADDMFSGIAQLWLQKCGSPVVFYLRRLVDAVIVWSVAVVLLVLAARLITGLFGLVGDYELLTLVPRLLLGSFAVGMIGFGLSPWMRNGTVVGVIAVYMTGIVIENDLMIRYELSGLFWTVLSRLMFPESALAGVDAFTGGRSDELWTHVGRIVLYGGGWLLVGLIGVARAVDRGALASSRDNDE